MNWYHIILGWKKWLRGIKQQDKARLSNDNQSGPKKWTNEYYLWRRGGENRGELVCGGDSEFIENGTKTACTDWRWTVTGFKWNVSYLPTSKHHTCEFRVLSPWQTSCLCCCRIYVVSTVEFSSFAVPFNELITTPSRILEWSKTTSRRLIRIVHLWSTYPDFFCYPRMSMDFLACGIYRSCRQFRRWSCLAHHLVFKRAISSRLVSCKRTTRWGYG